MSPATECQRDAHLTLHFLILGNSQIVWAPHQMIATSKCLVHPSAAPSRCDRWTLRARFVSDPGRLPYKILHQAPRRKQTLARHIALEYPSNPLTSLLTSSMVSSIYPPSHPVVSSSDFRHQKAVAEIRTTISFDNHYLREDDDHEPRSSIHLRYPSLPTFTPPQPLKFSHCSEASGVSYKLILRRS